MVIGCFLCFSLFFSWCAQLLNQMKEISLAFLGVWILFNIDLFFSLVSSYLSPFYSPIIYHSLMINISLIVTFVSVANFTLLSLIWLKDSSVCSMVSGSTYIFLIVSYCSLQIVHIFYWYVKFAVCTL